MSKYDHFIVSSALFRAMFARLVTDSSKRCLVPHTDENIFKSFKTGNKMYIQHTNYSSFCSIMGVSPLGKLKARIFLSTEPLLSIIK